MDSGQWDEGGKKISLRMFASQFLDLNDQQTSAIWTNLTARTWVIIDDLNVRHFGGTLDSLTLFLDTKLLPYQVHRTKKFKYLKLSSLTFDTLVRSLFIDSQYRLMREIIETYKAYEIWWSQHHQQGRQMEQRPSEIFTIGLYRAKSVQTAKQLFSINQYRDNGPFDRHIRKKVVACWYIYCRKQPGNITALQNLYKHAGGSSNVRCVNEWSDQTPLIGAACQMKNLLDSERSKVAQVSWERSGNSLALIRNSKFFDEDLLLKKIDMVYNDEYMILLMNKLFIE